MSMSSANMSGLCSSQRIRRHTSFGEYDVFSSEVFVLFSLRYSSRSVSQHLFCLPTVANVLLVFVLP